MQDEVFPDITHFGRIFRNQARMSGDGIAQIAAVMGSCTAGGAYVPAMSDESIVKAMAQYFLLASSCQSSNRRVVTAEEVGGADGYCPMGVADRFAEDEAEALRLVRNIVEILVQEN